MSDPMFEVDPALLESPKAPTVVEVTSGARDVVLGARAAENDPEHLALWIEVNGTNGNAYTYDIYFQSLADASEADSIYSIEELPVVVPASSAEKLQGARLDFSDEGDGGLVIVNPNIPPRPPRSWSSAIFRAISPKGSCPSWRSRSIRRSHRTAVAQTWSGWTGK